MDVGFGTLDGMQALETGDCHHEAPKSDFGHFTLERISESVRNAEESLATQSRVSGSRITARRGLPDEERVSYEGPLHKSCMKMLVDLIEGAYREHCHDLMAFLCEELTHAHERREFLVMVGNEAGYGSPVFQQAVVEWRKKLDLASDPLHQAQQERDKLCAVTFRRTLENVRHPRPQEPKSMCKTGKKRKHKDPPLVDVYYNACISRGMRMIGEVVDKRGPAILLKLLLEDLHHVQRRQQALFRAEMAAAMSPQWSQLSTMGFQTRFLQVR